MPRSSSSLNKGKNAGSNSPFPLSSVPSISDAISLTESITLPESSFILTSRARAASDSMERTAKGKTRRPAARIQFSPSFYGRISISSISFSFLHSTVSAAAANANNLKPSAHPQYLAYHTELQIRRRIFSSSSGKKARR